MDELERRKIARDRFRNLPTDEQERRITAVSERTQLDYTQPAQLTGSSSSLPLRESERGRVRANRERSKQRARLRHAVAMKKLGVTA